MARLWAGETLEDGAPQVVVEQDNKVIAMAKSDLLLIKHGEELDILPTGHYGHLNNVSVRKGIRGQGVGHTLVQAAFDIFATIQLDGYLLYFNPDNLLAYTFWSHLGFLPILRTYQRPMQEVHCALYFRYSPTCASYDPQSFKDHFPHVTTEGTRIEQENISVAPPDRRCLEQSFLPLGTGTKERRIRPAAAILFRSVANAYGVRIMGIVLKGMGLDETTGLHAA